MMYFDQMMLYMVSVDVVDFWPFYLYHGMLLMIGRVVMVVVIIIFIC